MTPPTWHSAASRFRGGLAQFGERCLRTRKALDADITAISELLQPLPIVENPRGQRRACNAHGVGDAIALSEKVCEVIHGRKMRANSRIVKRNCGIHPALQCGSRA